MVELVFPRRVLFAPCDELGILVDRHFVLVDFVGAEVRLAPKFRAADDVASGGNQHLRVEFARIGDQEFPDDNGQHESENRQRHDAEIERLLFRIARGLLGAHRSGIGGLDLRGFDGDYFRFERLHRLQHERPRSHGIRSADHPPEQRPKSAGEGILRHELLHDRTDRSDFALHRHRGIRLGGRDIFQSRDLVGTDTNRLRADGAVREIVGPQVLQRLACVLHHLEGRLFIEELRTLDPLLQARAIKGFVGVKDEAVALVGLKHGHDERMLHRRLGPRVGEKLHAVVLLLRAHGVEHVQADAPAHTELCGGVNLAPISPPEKLLHTIVPKLDADQRIG